MKKPSPVLGFFMCPRIKDTAHLSSGVEGNKRAPKHVIVPLSSFYILQDNHEEDGAWFSPADSMWMVP